MLPALPVVKFGVSVLASIPVSKITGDIIKNNVTVLTKMDHIKVVAGGIVIGGMVAKSVAKFTDGVVDELADAVTTMRNRKEATDTPVNIQE